MLIIVIQNIGKEAIRHHKKQKMKKLIVSLMIVLMTWFQS